MRNINENEINGGYDDVQALTEYTNKPKAFWAAVQSVSEHLGYSKHDHIIVPELDQINRALDELDLYGCVELAPELHEYLRDRGELLDNWVRPNLMTEEQARIEFQQLVDQLRPSCPLPHNKQSRANHAPRYLTCIINMLIEQHLGNAQCDYDPRQLVQITRSGSPVQTLSRRLDGAFPSPINPHAVWEVKEFYQNKSFGSRIAAAVYETALDGHEIKALSREGIDLSHYLMVDSFSAWWLRGKSYLCRLFDILHMGLVDEILFGREVFTNMPRLVQKWRAC